MNKYLLMASLLCVLSACPSNVAQSVNVSISPELLENLQGARGGATTGEPKPPTPSATPTGSPSVVPSALPSVVPSAVPGVDDQTRAAIVQMISENATALNQENYDAYIATVHPGSGLRDQMTQLFFYLVEFETQYFIENVTVLNQSEDRASVRVQQRISDVGGVVSSSIIYDLARDGSRWKIFAVRQDQGF